LTIENSCSSDIFCDSVDVCKNTVADYTYYIEGTTVDFVDASLYADSWYWDFGDGCFSAEKNPSHQFQGYGIYYVCLTASNPCSTDIFCDSIFNNPKGDNLNLVQVYPNPPSSNLTITNPTSLNEILVQIFTIYGDKVYEHEIDFENNSTYKIDLSDLPSAQYFLKMINGRKSETRKIFIVK
ncbi:MAG: T9SS type A sorting domain-containing protein, partial [Bacteroidales bacterium]|nr:T9SS type A sorting domain-containing protein [Bacteroidales bacterium]